MELSSITVRIASARRFVEALPGKGGVRSLKPLNVIVIEDFFVAFSKENGRGAQRSMQAALGLFLRFAAVRNWVKRDLAESVPKLRSYGMSSVPRGLSDAAVRTLVVGSATSSTRNHAIVLLLATYGVRRGQICSLRLEDIDWHNRILTFRPHKCGKSIMHGLTAPVARQLALYLQHERPDVEDRALFLRMREPYLPLGPAMVTSVVRTEMRRAGLECKPLGPHALRHAFAMRLLRGGQSLKSIADLLGHRSLGSVSLYAKVDHPRLLAVAADWPEVTS